MDTVKDHPYRLCELLGVGFLTADKIAASMGFDRLSTERVDEGLLYTLTEAEGCGHLCLEKHEFLKAALKLLDTPDLTFRMAVNRVARLDKVFRHSEGTGYSSTNSAISSSLHFRIWHSWFRV